MPQSNDKNFKLGHYRIARLLVRKLRGRYNLALATACQKKCRPENEGNCYDLDIQISARHTHRISDACLNVRATKGKCSAKRATRPVPTYRRSVGYLRSAFRKTEIGSVNSGFPAFILFRQFPRESTGS